MLNHLVRDNLPTNDEHYDFIIIPEDYEFTTGAAALLNLAGHGIGKIGVPQENIRVFEDAIPFHVGGFDFGDDNYCGTGLMTEVTHVDAKGRENPFTIGKDSGTYDLGSPEDKNIFRIKVKTLSANLGEGKYQPSILDIQELGESITQTGDFGGRSDRISIQVRQLNIPYMASLQARVLADSDKPSFLLSNPELLKQKVDEIIDHTLLMALRISKTVTTDVNGDYTTDITIPGDWPPGTIYIAIGYGYNADSEKSTGEKVADNVELATTLALVAFEIALTVLFPPLGLVVFATIDIWEIMTLFSRIPFGGKNKYGCSFSETTPLLAAYEIDYNKDSMAIYSDMSAQQEQFMKQLLADEEQNQKNSYIMVATALGALLIGGIMYYSMGE
tara:strand:+ start:13816 stop:14979 length:1164 start_codon:yes stop_codon:yes gene_type:complete